jgi:hypothetical protein
MISYVFEDLWRKKAPNSFCVRTLLTPLLRFSTVIICVRHERLQLVEIPHNRDILRYMEELWYSSLIFGSLERG